MKWLLSFLTFGVLFFVASCDPRLTVEPRETVMSKGMVLTATNKNGTVRITCLDSTRRKYEADGYTAIKDLTPRLERFEYDGQLGRGILGIYDPATTILPSFSPRWVLQEAERHFANQDELERFLVAGNEFMNWVYTPEGLVIGFGKDAGRGNEYSVDVFQCYIAGNKPQALAGAHAEKIRIEQR